MIPAAYENTVVHIPTAESLVAVMVALAVVAPSADRADNAVNDRSPTLHGVVASSSISTVTWACVDSPGIWTRNALEDAHPTINAAQATKTRIFLMTDPPKLYLVPCVVAGFHHLVS